MEQLITQPPISRRRKVLSLSPEVVLSAILTSNKDLPDSFCRLVADLPRNVRIAHVHYDPFSRVFAFLLEHEEFEEVPDGVRAPAISPKWEYVTFRKDRTEEAAKTDALIETTPAPELGQEPILEQLPLSHSFVDMGVKVKTACPSPEVEKRINFREFL